MFYIIQDILGQGGGGVGVGGGGGEVGGSLTGEGGGGISVQIFSFLVEFGMIYYTILTDFQ